MQKLDTRIQKNLKESKLKKINKKIRGKQKRQKIKGGPRANLSLRLGMATQSSPHSIGDGFY
jgi:hypothetical protein